MRALDRLAFFSDAVFAIAITLLVIDLRIPPVADAASDAEFAAAVAGVGSRVFAYVLSFAVIGIYWHAHWTAFRSFARVNERLVVLDLILLALVAFIPFPTALIGEYGDRPLAVAIYAASLAAAGIAGPVLWLYARRDGLVAHSERTSDGRGAALRPFVLPAVLLGSLLLLPFAPPAVVETSWLLVIPLQIVLSRISRRGRAEERNGRRSRATVASPNAGRER